MTLASTLRRPPRDIASDIAGRLDLAAADVTSVEVAGPGFLNFRLSAGSVAGELAGILEAADAFGRSDAGKGRRIMVEWVSANPTGPLHLGHGRQAALGAAIASLLEWTGWSVHREFYYNDAGKQMEMLARSVQVRYREELGLEGEIPEGGYHGAYVRDVARALVEREGDRYLEGDESEILEALRVFASSCLMDDINGDMAALGLAFDTYFQETSLYDGGRVDETARRLRDTGHVYDRDGAVWLRTTEFGDQKDRVMIKSDGSPTYFLPDIAYHVSKWERGFEHVINVQGADHHGTVPRVRAGLRALGFPEGYPEYVLHQMVTVVRGDEEVRLSKRAGSYTTLRELFQEVGVDVTRYFFQMRKPEAHLVFDLDVAQDRSDKNPVYKVKYAHARMNSIYAKAGVRGEDITVDGVDLDLLDSDAERQLITQLAAFPELVSRAAEARAPHLLCDWLEQTAGLVNSWYHAGNPSRNPQLAVLVDDESLRAARLVLVRAVQLVLRNGLGILGISAPERMDRTASPESPESPEE
jgi:arginyl-tRNA synthetase